MRFHIHFYSLQKLEESLNTKQSTKDSLTTLGKRLSNALQTRPCAAEEDLQRLHLEWNSLENEVKLRIEDIQSQLLQEEWETIRNKMTQLDTSLRKIEAGFERQSRVSSVRKRGDLDTLLAEAKVNGYI